MRAKYTEEDTHTQSVHFKPRARLFAHGRAVCTTTSALYTWGSCTVAALGCSKTLMAPVLLSRPRPSLYCNTLRFAAWVSLRMPRVSGTHSSADCASRTGVLLYLSMYGCVAEAMVIPLTETASAFICRTRRVRHEMHTSANEFTGSEIW